MISGTIGAGHWRVNEHDRVPKFNQARRQKGVGGVTGGHINPADIPGKPIRNCPRPPSKLSERNTKISKNKRRKISRYGG